MFSVTKTELKVFPLCTKKVWPTKSGVTIERRDQVLIGFFEPEEFILSIFSRRCDSTKGPFFNDLAIFFKSFVIGDQKFKGNASGSPTTVHRSRLLLGSSPFQNESVAWLMFGARFKAFRQLSPRADWMMTTAASL